MRAALVILALGCAVPALGAVRRVAIRSNIALNPGEAITITVPATEPMEIGWKTVQPQTCRVDCVRATDVSGGVNYSVATRLGASMKYTPAGQTIVIEYSNISTQPVAIDVYRIERTCEAEACRFIDERQKASWLVFKVDEFTSIATSRDASYSVISGVTTTGKRFRFRAIWWTDDPKAAIVNCAPFVKRYIDNRVPKAQYTPYVISGHAVGDASNIVLKAIDTCAPKASHFGVPDKNVYK
jgi:hypothetical protein